MKRRDIIYITIMMLILVTTACNQKARSPERVNGIPQIAEWAGGSDGGAWIVCEVKDTTQHRFSCQVYDDKTGKLEVSGDYLMKEKSSVNTEYRAVSTIPAKLKFQAFDGETIFLENNQFLIPEGNRRRQ
ncbi:MAG TPA: hypothetical protein VFZ34_00075 [Blastocatellia bacterium]|nr:hypothetical protein [Blastocatellia bacterium]